MPCRQVSNPACGGKEGSVSSNSQEQQQQDELQAGQQHPNPGSCFAGGRLSGEQQ
jgi:hypothetical protein